MNGRYQHMMGNTGGANANSYYAAASSSRQYNSPRGEVEYFEVEEGRPMQLERRHSRMVKINRSPSVRRTMAATGNEYFARHLPARMGHATANRRLHDNDKDQEHFKGKWASFARLITCCAPSFLLSRMGGMHDRNVQQAWREKIALILIIILLCGFVAFVTFGLNSTLCQPTKSATGRYSLEYPPRVPAGLTPFAIAGKWYAFEKSMLAKSHPTPSTRDSINFPSNRDITGLFSNQLKPQSCRDLGDSTPETDCRAADLPTHCHSLTIDYLQNATLNSVVSFEWTDLLTQTSDQHLAIYSGTIVDVARYFRAKQKFFGDKMEALLSDNRGKDITLQLSRQFSSQQIDCLLEKYQVGVLGKTTGGCFASQIISYAGLFIIMALVLVRLAMSIIYSWVVAPKLARDPRLDNGASQKSYANQQQPNRPQSAMPLDGPNNRDSLFGIGGARPQSLTRLNGNNNSGGNRMTSRFSSQIYTGDEYKTLFSKLRQAEEMEDKTSPYIIMLVTCYNEGREGLRATFDSLAATDYDDSHKLFFIVVDGLVDSGEGLNGEKLFCTDICIDLLDIEPSSEEPMARSYVAVAEGAKLHNMAKVYAGYYNHQGHKVPAVIVAKCGAPAEQHDSKPGNRGKRDSQLIMMNFISKILFEDRMSELEYELFEKIRQVADVTPDKYELVLAVDADTKVKEDSMRLLSNLFQNDPQVMGACGETCIANPRSTWVSAIQVYEYFVSHHSAKTFESLFGGVTCLPGCFSMYRLKSPKGKDGYWVPILASPDIIEVYSENSVKTLHQKNLFMLGEDRLLSTLLLKTFPRRKMMFLPAAQCYTIVPDKFSVLLSQRRRWINSTVHNLMELVLVKDLCGTFCFSMQFIVAMELFGTLVLPAAIIFTFFLIYSMATPASSFVNDSLIPLILLITILLLPSILILVAGKHPSMFVYFLIYLAAIFIWNFVLPVYAYWHFDDFGWGKTRQVAGEGKDGGHGSGGGRFDPKKLVMKRWIEWHREKQVESAGKAPLQSPPRSSRITSMHGKARLHQNRHRSMIFDDPPLSRQVFQPRTPSPIKGSSAPASAPSHMMNAIMMERQQQQQRPSSVVLLNNIQPGPLSPPTPSDLSTVLTAGEEQWTMRMAAPILHQPPAKASAAIFLSPLAKSPLPSPPTPPSKDSTPSRLLVSTPPPPPPIKDVTQLTTPSLPPRESMMPVAKPRVHRSHPPQSPFLAHQQQQLRQQDSPRSLFFSDLLEDSTLKRVLYNNNNNNNTGK